VKELLHKLNAEYGFQLTEAEMERILTEVRAAEALFEQLNRIDVAGKTPLMRLDVRAAKK
jgi:Asp-tRNA(Asn)/Glu-tRNA(Gln) amidotransferase C subunit